MADLLLYKQGLKYAREPVESETGWHPVAVPTNIHGRSESA